MFGIAWSELFIIGIVALVVVPPKDLPALMRSVGRWVSQMRRMAFDFQSQVNSALKEAEIDDLKRSVADLSKIDPIGDIRSEMDKVTAPMTFMEGQMRSEFSSMDSDLNSSLQQDLAIQPVTSEALPALGDADQTLPLAETSEPPAIEPPAEVLAAIEPPADVHAAIAAPLLADPVDPTVITSAETSETTPPVAPVETARVAHS